MRRNSIDDRLRKIRNQSRRLRRQIKGSLFPYGHPWASQQVWSIGIHTGRSPLHLAAPRHVRNPVLTVAEVTDVPAMLIADPFMVRRDQTWYMFFEVLNNRTKKGEIGLAVSQDGYSWAYRQIVLAEPFHLSYPYVFEYQNTVYMIPESYQANSVRLYRAQKFPTDWVFAATLLEGGYFADSSVIRYKGDWWMFTETGRGFKSDVLRLYFADELAGPWREHPQSPVVSGDPHVARPAGRLLALSDKLIRFAQDDYPTYGQRVWAFEILDLTRQRYTERMASPSPILQPCRQPWTRLGMHHVDAHKMNDGAWVACVDGLSVERLQAFVWRRRLRRWSAPRP